MANNLGNYITKFTTNLDKIAARETLTSDLNMNQNLLGEFNDAGEIQIPKMTVDGLADYDRATGFTTGGVTLEWETKKLRYDRGRAFEIDDMDDAERAAIVSANVMAEFERTKVVPEIDAIRFATLATNAGGTAAAALSTAAAAYSAVLAAEEAIEDENGSLDGCIFYLTGAVKSLLRQKAEYRMGQGENPDERFTTFDGMKMVTVPTARFNKTVTTSDNGFTGTGAINFMIVHPSAAAAIQRHRTLRYFAPDTNQTKDAHLWQFRIYHDLLTFDNKAGLVFAHTAE